MMIHLTCQTPNRFVRLAFLSLQPDSSISFGLLDKYYISPIFRAREHVWNAYNRMTASWLIPTNPIALQQVKNPHLTFHPCIMFHLTSNKAKQQNGPLWEGLCDVEVALGQQSEVPWIRTATAPLSELRSAGISWKKIPINDLGISAEHENVSMKIAVDFVGSAAAVTCGPGVWHVPWGRYHLRVSCLQCPPQLATLGWLHQA